MSIVIPASLKMEIKLSGGHVPLLAAISFSRISAVPSGATVLAPQKEKVNKIEKRKENSNHKLYFIFEVLYEKKKVTKTTYSRSLSMIAKTARLDFQSSLHGQPIC